MAGAELNVRGSLVFIDDRPAVKTAEGTVIYLEMPRFYYLPIRKGLKRDGRQGAGVRDPGPRESSDQGRRCPGAGSFDRRENVRDRIGPGGGAPTRGVLKDRRPWKRPGSGGEALIVPGAEPGPTDFSARLDGGGSPRRKGTENENRTPAGRRGTAGRFSTIQSPSCRSTMPRTIASPSPVPPNCRLRAASVL
jgi:hypothetical protein